MPEQSAAAERSPWVREDVVIRGTLESGDRYSCLDDAVGCQLHVENRCTLNERKDGGGDVVKRVVEGCGRGRWGGRILGRRTETEIARSQTATHSSS